MSAGLTFARVVRAEVVKLRTLRSTWVTFAIAVLVSDGVAVLVSALQGREEHRHGTPFLPDAATSALHGILFAQLPIGVLGVLFITGEYASGMIRSSITAVPRRTQVLLAKAVVFGTVTAIVSLALSFAAFFLSQLVFSTWNYDVPLSSPGARTAIFDCAIYLTTIGLAGLGIGWALRNTGGAIATLLGLLLVTPLIIQLLPGSWRDDIIQFLPLAIAGRMLTPFPDPSAHELSNVQGLLMMVVYASVALVIGWGLLKRRDV